MGCFDNILYNGDWYQTKDTPSQFQDNYEIRDGTLWYEDYDTEDQSDPEAKGIERLRGIWTKVNLRWRPCPEFTGEIVFYMDSECYSAYFVNGVMKHIEDLSPGEGKSYGKIV